MKKVIEYSVVVSYSTRELVGLVNKAIENGYQPIGGISSDKDCIRQAIVKYEECRDKPLLKEIGSTWGGNP